uniref:Variant surface glycoprotein 1125.4714 n=1 Tax=Trypanosoma brucei TaxID=5691 RepID=A0A1J0RAM7_9TRYP|nr:variant surface glycoprotein 1125.4714 [Trypanosoma brucei]
MKKALTLIYITMIVSALKAEAAAENAKEFAVLCTLYKACEAGSGLKETAAAAAIAPSMRTLVALNLTAADDEFFSRDFTKKPEGGQPDDNYTEYQDTWNDVKEKLKDGTLDIKGVKLTRLPANSQRHSLQQLTLSAIRYLKDKINALPTAQGTSDIDKTLKEAMFGTGQTDVQNSGTKTFGSSAANACGGNGGSTNNAGISLVNDLTCLCGGGDSAIEGCTHTGDTLTASGIASTSAAATTWGHVKAKCRKRPAISSALQTLASNLEEFRNLIGTKRDEDANGESHYGAGAAATCSGADEVSCINYKKQIDGDKLTIPWVEKITKALSDAKDHAQKEAAIQQLILTAEQTEQRALSTYQQAADLNKLTAVLKTNKPPSSVQTTEEQNKCTTQATNTTCVAAGCKWKGTDEKTGKCIVDESKVTTQTNTATGEKPKDGAASGVNCSKHTKKDDCKKENEGQKPGEKAHCEWI